MKKSLLAALLSVVAIAPAIAQNNAADTQAPKTRAEVRAELVRLEAAGYRPGLSNYVNYPEEIQAAEARVHQQDLAAAAHANTQAVAAGDHAQVVK